MKITRITEIKQEIDTLEKEEFALEMIDFQSEAEKRHLRGVRDRLIALKKELNQLVAE